MTANPARMTATAKSLGLCNFRLTVNNGNMAAAPPIAYRANNQAGMGEKRAGGASTFEKSVPERRAIK